MKYLTKLGFGSEFRWVDQKAGVVAVWVLASLTPRQLAMQEAMRKAVAGGRPRPGRRKKQK